jgi:hypothetical protein
MKLLVITLSGDGEKFVGWGDLGGDLTNAQYKPIQNCHSESSLYDEYILIKMGEKIVPERLFVYCLISQPHFLLLAGHLHSYRT